jgi:hypothetical protein
MILQLHLKPAEPVTPVLFLGITHAPFRPWAAVLLSFGVHVAGLLLVPPLGLFLSQFDESQSVRMARSVPPLRLHVRLTMLYIPPVLSARMPMNVTILQPKRPLTGQLSKVQQLAYWTPSPLLRPSNRFVEPAARPISKDLAQLNAPPSLEVPNREVALAEVNFSAPEPVLKPRLIRALSSTTPLGSANDAPARAGAGESVPGEPAQVIAFGPNPPRLSEYVTVPPVNQIGGSGPVVAGGVVNASAGTTASNDTVVPPSAVVDPPGMIRTVRPKGGKFAVVVTGSSSSGPYADLPSTLSGRLVYTVYVRVGTHRDWILQYCLPHDAVPTTKPVGGSSPLEAPYPFVIVRPPLPESADYEYLAVHGMVNTEGRFVELSFPEATDRRYRDVILDALSRWELRPANRGGQPVRVEFLLIIPREEA